MKDEILFTEKQRFNQWWLWIFLIALNCFFLFAVFKQVIGGEQFGDKPMGNSGLLITTGLIIILTILFINFRLETLIKKDGIYIRFFPFHLKLKHYTWTNLNKTFVRQYAPIAEYGGWGLRNGLFGNGKAFNVSGNKGLQLVFNNNKKLLIGTKKPTELIRIINKIDQLKK